VGIFFTAGTKSPPGGAEVGGGSGVSFFSFPGLGLEVGLETGSSGSGGGGGGRSSTFFLLDLELMAPLSGGAGELPRKVAAKAEGNPLAVGLIAFGVGLLAASLIPASTKEKELASSIKDSAQAAELTLSDSELATLG